MSVEIKADLNEILLTTVLHEFKKESPGNGKEKKLKGLWPTPGRENFFARKFYQFNAIDELE